MLSKFHKSRNIRILMVEQNNCDQKYVKVSPLKNKPQRILFDFCVASINVNIFTTYTICLYKLCFSFHVRLHHFNF